MSEINTKTRASGGKKGSEAREWIITFTVAIAIALIIRFFIFEFIVVNGHSMENTLMADEKLFVTKVEYYFTEPARGDIVICHFPGSKDYYVKRVIGLPGDTVAITGGTLYINGSPYTEGYIKEPMRRDYPETVVPEGRYFVMGDNRNDSNDSRAVGALERGAILSRVHAVVWPLNKLSWVQHEAPMPPAQ